MTPADFRANLLKIMPGYRWTVHKQAGPGRLVATGIQSSGFNRLSTVQVICDEILGGPTYTVSSAGHGTRATWIHSFKAGTLAQAFRGLQNFYRAEAAKYGAAAASLEKGRQQQPGPSTEPA